MRYCFKKKTEVAWLLTTDAPPRGCVVHIPPSKRLVITRSSLAHLRAGGQGQKHLKTRVSALKLRHPCVLRTDWNRSGLGHISTSKCAMCLHPDAKLFENSFFSYCSFFLPHPDSLPWASPIQTKGTLTILVPGPGIDMVSSLWKVQRTLFHGAPPVGSLASLNSLSFLDGEITGSIQPSCHKINCQNVLI